MRWRWLMAWVVLLAACGGRRATPIQPIGEVAQRSLLPQDPYADARRALYARQVVRERMFREAYEPGTLWGPLRVEQTDIDAGRIGAGQLGEIGHDLFTLDYGPQQGLGNGLGGRSRLVGPRQAPNLRHVHFRSFGGPDATRCLSCHHLGGDGGAGFRSDNAFFEGDGQTPATALERNPKALAGAALLQLLAEEMTAELQAIRLRARPGAQTPLVAKGVSFGVLRFDRGGRVDPGGLLGVDRDLVVRPFGWKGTVGTLREMVERSLQQHLGLQSEGWLRNHRRDLLLIGDGPDPADPDGDGVKREFTDGMVTALVSYVAALAPPIEAPIEQQDFLLRATQGAEFFQQLGCAGCHVPELPLSGTVLSAGPRASSGPLLDLAPLLTAAGRRGRLAGVRLYSDLRRHDMGPGLAEVRDDRGVQRQQWLTPPLWGVASTAPYLHDGRAVTLEAAILAHGGEAQAARDAYERLTVYDRGAVHLYLVTLDRPHHMELRR